MKLVNLDWLEVYCLEPAGLAIQDAAFFVAQGFEVKAREYGTPQYREMFAIYDREHFPMYEIRRNPYSIKANGGIFDARACHIRLSNRQCYQKDCVHLLREFLARFGYELKSISRVDVCADFNQFDNGKNPQQFLNQFIGGFYFKSLQSKLAAHGIEYVFANGARQSEIANSAVLSLYASENNEGREYNSIKWGAPTSAISTKMYNKTLELKQGKPKKYIQYYWQVAGLENDDQRPVWRVEFSLKSEIKSFVRLDDGELIYLNLSTIDSQAKVDGLFHVLAQRYFHFKRRRKTRNGTEQRKNRLPDFFPFRRWQNGEYNPIRLTLTKDPTRTDRIIMRRLREFWDEKEGEMTTTEKRGVMQFIRFMGYNFGEKELLKWYESHKLILSREE